jgi:hypothetical protein
MALPYLSDIVVDDSFPLSGLTTAALAFHALSGRLAWLEFDAGFVSEDGTEILDRGTGGSYAVTGTLGEDTHTSGGGTVRGGALFSGSQTINLGSILPTSADYSLFAVYKQSAETTQGIHTITGASGATYHGFYLTPTTGRLNLSHAAGLVQQGPTNHTPGSVYRVGLLWAQSPKVLEFQFGGSTETSNSETLNNTDPTLIVGNLPGLAGSRRFMGSLFHLSLFSRRLTGDDLAAVNTYLAEQYV